MYASLLERWPLLATPFALLRLSHCRRQDRRVSTAPSTHRPPRRRTVVCPSALCGPWPEIVQQFLWVCAAQEDAHMVQTAP